MLPGVIVVFVVFRVLWIWYSSYDTLGFVVWFVSLDLALVVDWYNTVFGILGVLVFWSSLGYRF